MLYQLSYASPTTAKYIAGNAVEFADTLPLRA